MITFTPEEHEVLMMAIQRENYIVNERNRHNANPIYEDMCRMFESIMDKLERLQKESDDD